MNLHEFQAKQLLADFVVPVPRGEVITAPEQFDDIAKRWPGQRWVAKAQIHAGARGKAGGVLVSADTVELKNFIRGLLGTRLTTAQTDSKGLPVNAILLEEATDIASELYLGLVVDRSSQKVCVMMSAAGGMDIETVAAETPDRIFTVLLHPVSGIQTYQVRQLLKNLGLPAALLASMTDLLKQVYQLFMAVDASQVEINPLVVTTDNKLIALDAKINIDDNALYAHPELAALRDESQEDEKESRAAKHGLNYISLDGNIGCMVNGAGLAMATMDLVQLNGGSPANFLDVGGGATPERVAEAFKIILSDSNVKAILVNIFGGIVRCDVIAEGIVAAIREVHVNVPVVVRLEGTNAEAGRTVLAQAGLDVIPAEDLAEAARQAVKVAG